MINEQMHVGATPAQATDNIDMNKFVDDLIFICERLNTLLIKETAAIDLRDTATLDAMLEEKELLCRAYESRGRPLIDNNTRINEVDDTMRTRLRDLVYEIEINMRNNTRRLAIEIESNKRFFDALADAARENAPKSGVYGGNGKLSSDMVAAPKGIPLSIDQTL